MGKKAMRENDWYGREDNLCIKEPEENSSKEIEKGTE